MENNHDKHTHTKTHTVVRANAGYWPFSCGFFCNRATDTDVIDPQHTEPKRDEDLTKKVIKP
jgi:hypothetical protein